MKDCCGLDKSYHQGMWRNGDQWGAASGGLQQPAGTVAHARWRHLNALQAESIQVPDHKGQRHLSQSNTLEEKPAEAEPQTLTAASKFSVRMALNIV